MFDIRGNKMTADKLNDDGVVLLICTVFGWYGSHERTDKEDADMMACLFGGGCATGNSHNDAYQLGLNMSRIALRKYTGKLLR